MKAPRSEVGEDDEIEAPTESKALELGRQGELGIAEMMQVFDEIKNTDVVFGNNLALSVGRHSRESLLDLNKMAIDDEMLSENTHYQDAT